MQRKVNKICRWLDLNCRSLVLDATTQPAAPQPLPEKRVLFTCNLQWKVPKSLKWRAIVKHEVSLYDLSTISFSCRLMQREWTSLVFWKKVVVLVRLFSETFIIGLSQTINRGSKMHFSKEMFKRKLQNFFNFPPLYSVPFIFFYQSISMPIFRAVHLFFFFFDLFEGLSHFWFASVVSYSDIDCILISIFLASSLPSESAFKLVYQPLSVYPMTLFQLLISFWSFFLLLGSFLFPAENLLSLTIEPGIAPMTISFEAIA